MSGRWASYYVNTEFEDFWRTRLSEKNASVCVVAGVGFDPRSLHALSIIAHTCSSAQIGYFALVLPPRATVGAGADAVRAQTESNVKELEGFTHGKCLGREQVHLLDAAGHSIGGRTAVNLLNNHFDALGKYRDIVVDVSGLPRAIFFPLISFLCARADQGKIRNLHIAVTEDPNLDDRIGRLEFGNADFVHSFRLQGTKKLIWLPVISKAEDTRLRKIYDYIRSDCIEKCPILPFPAKNLRRSDDILVNLREVLFNEFAVSKNNILLCDERTPFDIYRKIIQIHDYYQERLSALSSLGEVTTVVSPLSTKTLSLGMLLAAIEKKLPVCYVESGSYTLNTDSPSYRDVSSRTAPMEVWLTGEPYETSEQAESEVQ
jgi:hypothetical protein